jgi:hypothetical protein
MSINLVQWEGSTVTPKLDAIMYDDGSYGIIKGCAITHQGTNLLKIANGFIKIAGRLIEIAEETIQCQVSASGTVNGQLWLRLDLSSVTPAVFMTEAAAVLTPLTQNADCNFQNGIYEIQLATYNIDESVITNLVETAPELEKLRTALENIDLAANKVTYDNTHSGLSANKVQGAIDEINDNLTEKVTKFSGTDSGNTYVTVDGLAYDATNKKLGLKVNGADTVIPFSGEPKVIPYSIHTLDGVTIDLGFVPKYLYFWHGDRGNFGIYINDGTYSKKVCCSYENNNVWFDNGALTVNGTSITILPLQGGSPSQYRYGDGFVVAFG